MYLHTISFHTTCLHNKLVSFSSRYGLSDFKNGPDGWQKLCCNKKCTTQFNDLFIPAFMENVDFDKGIFYVGKWTILPRVQFIKFSHNCLT